MIPNSIDQLTADDFHRLVTSRAEEGPTLEFKRDLPHDDRDSRKEFVADICALANSKGGDIIFGIEEDAEGLAMRVVPHDFNADNVITQLTNVLADGLEPRLHGVTMRAVDIDRAGKVLVIRVPRSYAGIHRSQRDAHFWVRESRSKRQLDVAGITNRVADVLGRQDRLADFFARRYAAVATDSYPLALNPGPKVVLHILPTRDLLNGEEMDLSAVGESGQFWVMSIGRSAFASHTLEGILHHPPVNEQSGAIRAGTLVMRSGIVEAVSDQPLMRNGINEPEFLPFESIEARCVQFLRPCLQFSVEHLAKGWPVTIRIAIVGHGQCIGQSQNRDFRWHVGYVPPIRVHEAVLRLPDTLLEAEPPSIPAALRPAFDRLWQAWGYPRSFSFQQQNGELIWQTERQ